jgi:hypothetical protein
MLKCGCTGCVMMNGTPICCGTEASAPAGKSR